MADSVLVRLRQLGFSELACQFAALVERGDKTGDSVIAVSAALLSDAVSQGKVHLDLNTVGQSDSELDELLPEAVADWSQRLLLSHWVVASEQLTAESIAPMVLTPHGQLYLYRYWQDEQYVQQFIKTHLETIALTDLDQARQDFAQWQHEVVGTDWQKVAVMMALTRQFCVISGGPGTGKTTIVLQLLRMLLSQDIQFQVALAAPTGKAAMRLQQAVSSQTHLALEAKTLHRLLGITEDNDRGQYHSGRTLPVDMVIVDEASMIDVSVMATLIKALPEHARLVLLGDSDQLASIESGTVLADVCEQGVAFTAEFRAQLATVTGIEIETQGSPLNLADSVVLLQHSYRFGQDSIVGRLAQLIRQGDDVQVVQQLSAYGDSVWRQSFAVQEIEQQAAKLYGEFVMAVKARRSAEACLSLFEQSRFLCALKQGPESVESVNRLIERWLMRQGLRTQHRFYHGRPIMITKNDYRHGLFNGDTGLILYDQQGQLAACFMTQQGVRWLPLNRIPAHETAYAMTVHKSQGSEFEQVCIVLPGVNSPVLNRSLLYTAVTRAKTNVSIICEAGILSNCVKV